MHKYWQVIKIIKKLIDITFSSENYFHVQLADKHILTIITYIRLEIFAKQPPHFNHLSFILFHSIHFLRLVALAIQFQFWLFMVLAGFKS